MSTYNSPGVYVEEVATLPASVAQVATAIPAFLGYTKNNLSEPVRITSMAEFVAVCGGPDTAAASSLQIQIASATVNSKTVYSIGGTIAYPTATMRSLLYYSMQLYFANGGGPCYVASTGVFTATPNKNHFVTAAGNALDKLKLEDEPTLLVPVDATLLGATGYYDVVEQCLAQCNDLKDRFTIVDTVESNTSSNTDVEDLRDEIGNNYLSYGAAYYPYLNTTLTLPDEAVVFTGASTVTLAAAKLATSGAPADIMAQLKDQISKLVGDYLLTLPPSGAIAGIYAAVDRSRGVWKAPANVSINSVVEPEVRVTDAEQGDMNVDATSGKSINAIRHFTGKGNLVWGARTLAGNDNEWRYVPVRRLYITVEESIAKATAFSVFEPNDANTWSKLKAMIENYLTNLWRQGALAGSKPEQAFFVNVGLGVTMVPDDILNGNLIIEVGMAAVRPAEFIILRFSHKMQEA